MHLRLTIGFLIFCHASWAQSYFDVVNLNYRHAQFYPSEQDQFSYSRYSAEFNGAFKIHKENMLLAGASYENQTFRDLNPLDNLSLTTHSSAFNIGYLRNSENKKWKGAAQLRVRNNADNLKLENSSWQIGGAFLITRIHSEKLQLFAGTYYNKEFFGPLVFPIAGADWQINSRTHCYILIPNNIRLEYALKPQKWYIGFAANTQMISYRMAGDEVADYFKKQEVMARFFAERRLAKNVYAFAETGYFVANSFRFFDKNDQEVHTEAIGNGLAENWFTNAGAAYRMRLKN